MICTERREEEGREGGVLYSLKGWVRGYLYRMERGRRNEGEGGRVSIQNEGVSEMKFVQNEERGKMGLQNEGGEVRPHLPPTPSTRTTADRTKCRWRAFQTRGRTQAPLMTTTTVAIVVVTMVTNDERR
jgi:hypothetical protein